MKKCRLQSYEWIKVAVWTFCLIAAILALMAFILDPISREFWFFFLLAAIPFFWERILRRCREAACFQNGCDSPNHFINNCSGKCHHWCRVKDDADLALYPEKGEEVQEDEECDECRWTHAVLKPLDLGSYDFKECPCPCHDQKRRSAPRKPQFRCRCHQWCYGKLK